MTFSIPAGVSLMNLTTMTAEPLTEITDIRVRITIIDEAVGSQNSLLTSLLSMNLEFIKTKVEDKAEWKAPSNHLYQHHMHLGINEGYSPMDLYFKSSISTPILTYEQLKQARLNCDIYNARADFRNVDGDLDYELKLLSIDYGFDDTMLFYVIVQTEGTYLDIQDIPPSFDSDTVTF